MKRILTIAVLAVGVLVWRMGAMEQPQGKKQKYSEFTLISSDNVSITVPVDIARLSITVNDAYEFEPATGDVNEPILLKNVSAAELRHMLIDEVPQILAVHRAYNHGKDANPAAISEMSYKVRQERAEITACALPVASYSAEELVTMMGYFHATVYLQIPELMERYARAIADMLTSNAGLAALSRDARILNQITAGMEHVISKYIPQWADSFTLKGHGDTINSAVFSPNGSKVVTASTDKTARIWNATTGALEHILTHGNRVNSAVFSPDGSKVVTASLDKTAKIWNVTTGALERTLTHDDWVNSAVFSPDGSKVVTASFDNTAKIWNAATGVLGHTLAYNNALVYSAVFSPDGSKVVTASGDRTAKIWNAATGALERTLAHGGLVYSAVFLPDGSKVVTASDDKTAKIWNATTGALERTLAHDDSVKSAVFSPDGNRVVTASDDNTAKIWNAATGALERTLAHDDPVKSAVFSPNGSKVVTASSDKTAKIWNANTGVLEHTLTHGNRVNSAVFSPDGSKVVTASWDDTAKIVQLLPSALPGVADLDAILFIRLLFWAHIHHQKITDTAWAPRVLNSIGWHAINHVDKKLLQGWVREVMQS